MVAAVHAARAREAGAVVVAASVAATGDLPRKMLADR